MRSPKGETGVIRDIDIRSLANDASFTRGSRYYNNSQVVELQQKPLDERCYTAKVQGSSAAAYEVEVELTQDRCHVSDYCCDCPAALRSYREGACKHVVAVLKAIQHEQSLQEEGNQHAASGMRLFSFFSREAEREEKIGDAEPLQLVPRLCVIREYGNVTCWLEFRIGYERLYVLSHIRNFMLAVREGTVESINKSLQIDTRRMSFAPGLSAELWQLLRTAWEDEESLLTYSTYFRSSYAAGSQIFEGKRFKLSPGTLRRFLSIMGEEPFEFVLDGLQKREVHVQKGNPDLSIEVEERQQSGRISLATEGVIPLNVACSYVLVEDTIYEVEADFARGLKPLMEGFRAARHLKIPAASMGDFFGRLLPELEKIAKVHVAPAFLERFEILPLSAEVFIDYYEDGIAARLKYHYAGYDFNPLLQANLPAEKERIIVRDALTEHQIEHLFRQYRFEIKKGQWVQPDEEKTYDFLTEALPQLANIADVYYSEIFRKKPVQSLGKVTVGVSISDDNMLQLSMPKQAFDFDELLDILASYRLKRRYHRLKDGTFVTLGEQQLGALADFVESTGLKKTDSDSVELPLSRAMYVDALAREDEGLRLERSRRFKEIVRDIKNPADADIEVPACLKGVLRDYQVTGFCWLSALASYGLGGILADDMGLGKTLQVIAFLLAHREKDAPPALVVAPTSLMYNWLDEIERFAPQLKASVIAGSKKEREAALAVDGGYDVIVTTYNMLKRDIALYEKQRFSYCFLDEAQHIKNPSTQNAKAVKKLRTGGYFALTGTPIENTLTELWSIFDFLMPGYLFNHKLFKQRFEVPIVRAKDGHAMKNLNRHVAPFILRRLKKDVLKELPDKVESRMVNEMTPKQAKVYTAYFVQAQKEFAAELKAHGFGESRIKILALLTRLRQIACDPSLFLEDYDGGSGKLDMLEEVVSEAVEAGHRLLIFSQFTSMLQRIASRLDEQGLEYEYLDGQTPALERIRLVKDFNAGSQPVFLISLKAGGTGLNLTGADMVIHYDPWWNPAVEDQATDRAYRIGQKNNVQVLKFITKDTIEEQIYTLQQRKKALIDQMIQPGENFLTQLSEEEIRALFAGR